MPQYDYNSKISLQGQNVTISSGGTKSNALDVGGHGLVGMIMPAAFTGTSVTFEGSWDGTNFFPIYNTDGTQFSATVSTSRLIAFAPSDFVSCRLVKIVSSSTEGADRVINLIIRGLV